MFNISTPGQVIRVAFILVDGFSLVPFVAASEPMRMANRLLGRVVFDWSLLTQSDAPVRAGNGMEVLPTGPIRTVGTFSNVIVTGGFEPKIITPRWLSRLLRNVANAGAVVGSLGTGTYHLARAGLLHGQKATLHWEYEAGFAREFPDVRVTRSLFEIGSNRMTCSGGTAALDMMIHLIAKQVNAGLATSVADTFIHGRIRSPLDVQKVLLPVEAVRSPIEVNAAVALMQRDVEARVSVEKIAREIGVSRRHLHRLFLQHTGKSPLAFANQLRLERARSLVMHTGLKIRDIAEMSGFGTLASFSKAYRHAFGESPRKERKPKLDITTLRSASA